MNARAALFTPLVGSLLALLFVVAATLGVVVVFRLRDQREERSHFIRHARLASLPIGAVEISGQVNVIDRPLISPLQGAACVVHRCIVSARRAGGWVHVGDVNGAVDFLVYDGSDSIVVDGRTVTCDLGPQSREFTELPLRLREALASSARQLDAPVLQYRVTEECLRLNDVLHVVLRVRRAGSASNAAYEILRIGLEPVLPPREDRTMLAAGLFIVVATLTSYFFIVFPR